MICGGQRPPCHGKICRVELSRKKEHQLHRLCGETQLTILKTRKEVSVSGVTETEESNTGGHTEVSSQATVRIQFSF